MAKADSSPLTDAQREIMEIVWERGEATVREVRDALADLLRASLAGRPQGDMHELHLRAEPTESGWVRIGVHCRRQQEPEANPIAAPAAPAANAILVAGIQHEADLYLLLPGAARASGAGLQARRRQPSAL